VKNRQRFNFGVLYPRAYAERQTGSDTWEMKIECLASATAAAAVEVKVRFLQMRDEQGRQEGQERDVCIKSCALGLLHSARFHRQFTFDDLAGEFDLSACQLEKGLFKIELRIRNRSRFASIQHREDALLQSMVSVHSILNLQGGEFVSLLDPPEHLKGAAAACRNVGAWPVLAGEEGQRDTMLAAPIILYDYPRIAPESPGDLFDGTEIDEILALRILTLTDDEKREVRRGDDRARRILERTEMMPPEHFQKLHGALRGLRESSS
jgi:hypothetical protein